MRILPLLALGIAILGVTGCGGGGGSSTGATIDRATVRSVAIHAGRVGLTLNISEIFGSSTRAESRTPRIDILMSSRAGPPPPPDFEGRDADLDLWYKRKYQANSAYLFNYFTDPNYLSPAGFWQWNAPVMTGGTYPSSQHAAFKLTAGQSLVEGTADYKFNESAHTSGAVKAHYLDTSLTPFTVDMDFTVLSPTRYYGTLKVTDDTGWLQLAVSTDQSQSSVFQLTTSVGIQGELTLNANRSGHLTLESTSGGRLAVMTWGSDGRGTLTYADNSSESVTLIVD